MAGRATFTFLSQLRALATAFPSRGASLHAPSRIPFHSPYIVNIEKKESCEVYYKQKQMIVETLSHHLHFPHQYQYMLLDIFLSWSLSYLSLDIQVPQ